MLTFREWIKREGLDLGPALGTALSKAIGDVVDKKLKDKEEELKKSKPLGVAPITPRVAGKQDQEALNQAVAAALIAQGGGQKT